MEILCIYLTIINAVCFLVMLTDKRKAIKNRRRVPERTLLGLCAIGGSLGGFAAMRLFRHKTLHLRFSIGIPVMLAVQTVLLMLIYRWI